MIVVPNELAAQLSAATHESENRMGCAEHLRVGMHILAAVDAIAWMEELVVEH